MSFINMLRLILNGKKSKSLMKDGWMIDYEYSHISDFFYPVPLFAELNYKLIGVPENACFPYKGALSLGNAFWKEDQKMHLKLSAKVKVLGLPLKINRYVKKVDNRPTTVYKLWYDEKPLAVWHKKYEFGREYHSDVQSAFTLEAMGAETFSKTKNWGSNQILGHNGENECCLIEKFVHTHILVIHDSTTFASLWEVLKKKID
ncbi:hypothetical protein [Rhodonellum sp.]|uniref:hypothetical protein n=1 Tax=Rhodonellum sp. TaxID=2231180 RepID=UPI00271EA6D2|nr:hypothetical protein [Rhodonellum sp.]MDO9551136.1 hypothetical protein [Rhodonellum sp.]